MSRNGMICCGRKKDMASFRPLLRDVVSILGQGRSPLSLTIGRNSLPFPLSPPPSSPLISRQTFSTFAFYSPPGFFFVAPAAAPLVVHAGGVVGGGGEGGGEDDVGLHVVLLVPLVGGERAEGAVAVVVAVRLLGCFCCSALFLGIRFLAVQVVLAGVPEMKLRFCC